MKRPKCPPKGKVIVLSNSYFDEWNPDIVPKLFNNVADAEEWIRDVLDEEGGDLYVILSIESYIWTQVNIRKHVRKNEHTKQL